VCPRGEAGRGPTRSTCTCENRCSGIGILSTGVEHVPPGLPRAHPVHSLHQVLTAAAHPFHTKRLLTSRLVALFPGCARPCSAWKMRFCHATGTRGRGVPVDTSHSSCVPFSSSLTTRSVEEAASCCVAWHVLCCAAMSA
jgi:hypothetical protein